MVVASNKNKKKRCQADNALKRVERQSIYMEDKALLGQRLQQAGWFYMECTAQLEHPGRRTS